MLAAVLIIISLKSREVARVYFYLEMIQFLHTESIPMSEFESRSFNQVIALISMKNLFFYVDLKLNMAALFITLAIDQFYITQAFSLTEQGGDARSIGFDSFAVIPISLFFLLIIAMFFAKPSHYMRKLRIQSLENNKLLNRFNEGVIVIGEDNDEEEEALPAEPVKKENSGRSVKFCTDQAIGLLQQPRLPQSATSL